MALADFTDRSVRVQTSMYTFVLRPLTILGMLEAQGILASALDGGSDPVKEHYVDLQMAVIQKDEAAASKALAEIYLTILDQIGTERLSRILALMCRDSTEREIAVALEREPGIVAKFLEAAATLHDLPRLLARFASTAGPQILPAHVADTEGIGLETILVDLAHFLPGYTVEAMLQWPYERLLSMQEQVAILRSLARGESAGPPRAATAEELRRSGINVQSRPAKVH